MISADTIAALEAAKIEYILGVRERTSREVRAEIIEDDGLAVPLVIPRQKGETELAIRETTIAGRRYVVCRNQEQARKDAMARAELVAGLERKLAQGDKALVANNGFRRFLKTPEGDGFVIDRAQSLPSRRRGSRPRPGSTVSSCCAPAPKSPLSESCCATAICSPWRTPSKPQRHCSPPARSSTRPTPASAATSSAPFSPWSRKELFDRLAARRSRLEWQRIVDDLADLSEIDVEQDGRRALLRTAPGPTIDPICRAIGLTLPPVFQEMPPAA